VFGEDTPTNVQGSFVLPGTYTITLAAGGQTLRAPLAVSMDPRVRTEPAGLQQLFNFSRQLDQSIEQVRTAHEARSSLQEQLESLTAHLAGDPAHSALLQEATSVRQSLGRSGPDTDLGSISERLVALKADVESADLAPTSAQRQVFAYYTEAFDRSMLEWHSLTRTTLASLNEHLRTAKMAPLAAPGAAGASPND
jgi:hypothetical protein